MNKEEKRVLEKKSDWILPYSDDFTENKILDTLAEYYYN